MAFGPDSPLLFVGLGNPGSKYQHTPHNLGFEVIDEFLARLRSMSKSSSKFEAEIFHLDRPEGRRVFLLKPLTFMNLSGRSVQAAAAFYKIPHENIVVISDDLDLPVGQLRLRQSGGSGGHNGLKSLIECLGTELFPRIRIGVGRPEEIPGDVFLLAKIPEADRAPFQLAVKKAADCLDTVLKDGWMKAMNHFNKKEEIK